MVAASFLGVGGAGGEGGGVRGGKNGAGAEEACEAAGGEFRRGVVVDACLVGGVEIKLLLREGGGLEGHGECVCWFQVWESVGGFAGVDGGEEGECVCGRGLLSGDDVSSPVVTWMMWGFGVR